MVYRVAIIGCGNIGSQWSELFSQWPVTHIAAYKAVPSVTVVGVCDLDVSKAKHCAEKWNVPHFYSDAREMMTELQPDIVSICTPCEDHAQTLKMVLEFPVKGIFCEKPIADSKAKAEEMIASCKTKRIPLVINHIRRYDKLHQQVRREINNLVGIPQKIVFLYSGGIITNGSHLFDLLHFYFGNFEWVQAEKEGDNLNILFQLKNGIGGTILSFHFKDTSIFDLTIIGDQARLDLINKYFWDYEYRYFPKERNEMYPAVNFFSSRHKEILGREWERDFFVGAIQDLINCIERNKKPISSGEDGLAALEVILAALYSAEHHGERVYFPFTTDLILPITGSEFRQWQKN